MLTIASVGALAIGQWTQPAALWQLIGAASALVLAYALVDSVLPRRTDRDSAEGATARPTVAPAPSEAPDQGPLACPVGQTDCWALATVMGLISASKDVTPRLEVSQATNTLAHRACDLIGADAAWVYRAAAGSEAVTLVASHLQPQAVGHWDTLTARAQRIAEETVRSFLRHDLRANRRLPVAVVREYLAVPLERRRQLLGVLVVHGTETKEAPPGLKEELLVSLAAQAAVTLENGILYESQRDTQAKLRQFGLHRADYVSTLSHELRTPLTSIKGFAQLLKRDAGVSGDGVRSYAATIVAEADKLALIVHDIVDLTRMETGLLELHRRPASLGRLVKAVGQRVQSMAPTLRLKTSLPDRLPTVRIDPKRMEQVVERLLVGAASQSSPGSAVLLAVETGDEGALIRLEYRASEEHIESLAQALKGLGQTGDDGQATQLGRGKLGLYICRNFIEAHDGKMWVEHPEEQVARVVFTLPY
ncbi:MAG: sensor histidine kinase [Chloroflexota bacterium]